MAQNELTILQKLDVTVSSCNACELHKGRIKPVIARGNIESPVMICGMCPGPEENKAGVPFVGTAGQILNEILVRVFGSSDSIYITNLVKCFVPPGNPLKPEWMTNCLPFLVVQIVAIRPKVIITLGRDVANFLLGNDLQMGQMRGNIYDYFGAKLISTYHPSYLARGGGVKHRHFGRVINDFEKAIRYTTSHTWPDGAAINSRTS